MYLFIKNEMIDIKDYGLRCLKYFVPPPASDDVTEQIDGMDGRLFIESFYSDRTIRVELALKGKSIEDMRKLKTKFNRLFAQKEEFFVVFKAEPHRRYRVKLANVPDWEAASQRLASTTVEFKMYGIYAESPGTTLKMPPFYHYYQVGDGKIDEGDPVVQYIHSTNNFAVFNDSDVPIDPRNKEIVIELKGMLVNPSIINSTTGDEWSWTGSAAKDDVIKLDGIRSLKNGQSIFKDTNKKLISLVPGWNYFEISGATDFTISFDFRFYYI
ncbi:phage tail family protein [Bacillus sp. Hm123]|uniref:phage tail family protein n=1 Tax=Bacillus sp. Hm123 TaxID=3450745 RepID=UPI003F42F9B0